jgi:hypothetical protein
MMKQTAVIQCTKPYHAAPEIEDDQEGQHADDEDGADPAQRHFMEAPPIPAGRLFDGVRGHVGNCAPSLDLPQFLQELLFLDRPVLRTARSRLLGEGGRREHHDEQQRQKDTDQRTNARQRRHATISPFFCSAKPPEQAPAARCLPPYDAIVSR